MRDRRAEQRHDFVANKLVDGAGVLLDNGDQTFEAGVDQCSHLFGIQFLGQRGESGNIGKNNRDDLALITRGANARGRVQLGKLVAQRRQSRLDYRVTKRGTLRFQTRYRGGQFFRLLFSVRHSDDKRDSNPRPRIGYRVFYKISSELSSYLYSTTCTPSLELRWA